MIKSKSNLTVVCSMLTLSCLLISPLNYAEEANKAKASADPAESKEAPVKATVINKPGPSISGHPLGTRDNYTINSDKEQLIDFECVFINTSPEPATINLWTNPEEIQPQQVINLDPGSKTKPTQKQEKLQLTLAESWWCRVYTKPEEYPQWDYCSYLAIGDANFKNYNPFASINHKEDRKPHVSYQCRIQNPKQGINFFFTRH